MRRPQVRLGNTQTLRTRLYNQYITDMPTITKRLLDAIEPDGRLRIIADDDLTGFAVQVAPAGTISFCVDYRVDGKRRRKVIGRYGPLTVDAARKLALKHLGTATAGDDPLPVLDTHFPTIEALFKAWIARHCEVHLKRSSVAYYKDVYRARIGPRFGQRAPSKLTFADVAEEHAELADRPTAANRTVATLRAMLAWAHDQRLIRFKNGLNPADGHRRYRERARARFLSVPEIRTFITDLPRASMDDTTRRALMLELLLAPRGAEVTTMRKGDVDLVAATWSIPAPVMKSNNPHMVPLPPWSRRIISEAIAEAKGVYLFPSPRGDPTSKDAAPIERHALGTALRRAQRPVNQDGTPAPRKKTDIWVFDFRDRHGAPNPITPHDLRRTCSSFLELLGYSDVIRGAILDHADSRNITAKHYSAAELIRLKRTALLDWEAALRKIMAGEDPFSASIEDDRAEEARLLGIDDPDAAPIPSAPSPASTT